MSKERKSYDIRGLRTTTDDFFASLKSDHVFVMVSCGESGQNSFLVNVQTITKVSGYFDFWRIEGWTNGSDPITIYVDYYKTVEAGYPEGGFGYLEV